MKKLIKPSLVGGVLDAPASKSYAQRAVAAALLADGTSVLRNMDLCNDTAAALEVARRLGAEISNEGRTYTVKGGMSPLSQELNIGESGLGTRLFTPIASLADRPVTVTGHGSILTRPIGMMEKPLRDLGVEVTTAAGFLPITVSGPLRGGTAEVDGSLSSQFLTGLLMALPKARRNSVLRVKELNSKPYIDMTIETIREFGIVVEHDNYEVFRVAGNQEYIPADYNVEGDWSGASCLLVAGAVAGSVMVKNLNSLSRQADQAIVTALNRAGANILNGNGNTYTVSRNQLKGFEFDATHCPDLFPALVALAANCEEKTVITGTRRLTGKESDRAVTLADTFGRLGISVDISADDVMVVQGGPIEGGTIHSHNDHRIAMAGAVAALTARGPVEIEGAEAVDKSYPGFWEDLDSITKK